MTSVAKTSVPRKAAIAGQRFKAGDVIIDCKPLVHCIDNFFKGLHCDHCLKESDSLQKCSKCHEMHYCGKDCQQTDWKYHKKECKVFRHNNFSMDRTTGSERLLLRFYLCFTTDPKFATTRHQTPDGKDVSVNEMEVDINRFTKDREVMEEFEVILDNFKDCDIKVCREELLRWFALLSHRCAGIPLMVYSEDNMIISCIKPVGFGFFIGLYDLSHSCLPNSSHVSNGLSLQLRALKTIEPNEKITITFTDLKQNKDKRQRDLKERFGFVCQCDKCRLNLDEDIDYNLFYKMLEEVQTYYQKIRNQFSRKLASKKLHELDFEINWNLFLYMKAIYGQYFPYVTQTLVLHFICFALSKYSDKSLVKLWYKEVEDSLRVTHDSEHPIYKLFRKVYLKSISLKH